MCDYTSIHIVYVYAYIWGFPGGSDSKESACSAGNTGLIPSQEDPLQEKMATHSSTCLENPMKRKAWQATVHGLAKELDTTEHTENLNLSTHREHLSPTPTH